MYSASVTLTSRLRVAVRAASLHLILSALFASLVAALVLRWWFPTPFSELAGGLNLMWLIISVDVVCGPILTLLLFSPVKTKLALGVDLTLVVSLQLSALGYGLHALSQARPLAIVFEVDRFRVICLADIPASSLADAPAWVRSWGIEPPRVIGTRRATSLGEKISSIDASLQGVEPSAQPRRWQDYSASRPDVVARALPLASLRHAYPRQLAHIERLASVAAANPMPGEATDPGSLLWLPLVSRHSMEWVVLLDPNSLRIRGHIPIDGFLAN